MKNPTELDPLAAHRAARPPAGLRERVLARARTAAARVPDGPDVWTRLVRSRAARLAWGAAIVALVAAHLALPGPRRAAPTTYLVARPLPPDSSPELVELARLPAIEPSAALDAVVAPAKENGG